MRSFPTLDRASTGRALRASGGALLVELREREALAAARDAAESFFRQSDATKAATNGAPADRDDDDDGVVGGLGYHDDRAERKQWLNLPVSRYAFTDEEDFVDGDADGDDDDADDTDFLDGLALPGWLDSALKPAVSVLLSTAKVRCFVLDSSLHRSSLSAPSCVACDWCSRFDVRTAGGRHGGWWRAQKIVTAAYLDAVQVRGDTTDYTATQQPAASSAASALLRGALASSVLTLFSRRGDGGGGCSAHVDRGILTLVYSAEVSR